MPFRLRNIFSQTRTSICTLRARSDSQPTFCAKRERSDSKILSTFWFQKSWICLLIRLERSKSKPSETRDFAVKAETQASQLRKGFCSSWITWPDSPREAKESEQASWHHSSKPGNLETGGSENDIYGKLTPTSYQKLVRVREQKYNFTKDSVSICEAAESEQA